MDNNIQQTQQDHKMKDAVVHQLRRFRLWGKKWSSFLRHSLTFRIIMTLLVAQAWGIIVANDHDNTFGRFPIIGSLSGVVLIFCVPFSFFGNLLMPKNDYKSYIPWKSLSAANVDKLVGLWEQALARMEKENHVLRTLAISALVAIFLVKHLSQYKGGTMTMYVESIFLLTSILCSLMAYPLISKFHIQKEKFLLAFPLKVNLFNIRKMYTLLRFLSRRRQLQWGYLIFAVSFAGTAFVYEVVSGKLEKMEKKETTISDEKLMEQYKEKFSKTLMEWEEQKNNLAIFGLDGQVHVSDAAIREFNAQFQSLYEDLRQYRRECHNMTDVLLMLRDHPECRDKTELLRQNIRRMGPWMVQYLRYRSIWDSLEVKMVDAGVIKNFNKFFYIMQCQNIFYDDTLTALYNLFDLTENPTTYKEEHLSYRLPPLIQLRHRDIETRYFMYIILQQTQFALYNNDPLLGAWSLYLWRKRWPFSSAVMDKMD